VSTVADAWERPARRREGARRLAGHRTVVGEVLQALVPRPEHLAAMKVLAMRNDPARTFQEMSDIRHLLTLPGVDEQEIRGYFAKHGLESRFDEIKKTISG
jgi:hypothetical protein